MVITQRFKQTGIFVVLFLAISCKSSPGPDTKKTESQAADQEVVMRKAVVDPVAEESFRQAALDGETAKMRGLFEDMVNVDAPDQDGHTALMFAAYNGHTETIRVLVEAGAMIDRRDLMGRTALLYASTGPFPDAVRLLLKKGAKPNIVDSDEHFTPLMHAAAEGHLDVVKLLLENGADLSLRDVDGDDAESFARQAGHTQVADYLHDVR